jgi:hypothetical protein
MIVNIHSFDFMCIFVNLLGVLCITFNLWCNYIKKNPSHYLINIFIRFHYFRSNMIFNFGICRIYFFITKLNFRVKILFYFFFFFYLKKIFIYIYILIIYFIFIINKFIIIIYIYTLNFITHLYTLKYKNYLHI